VYNFETKVILIYNTAICYMPKFAAVRLLVGHFLLLWIKNARFFVGLLLLQVRIIEMFQKFDFDGMKIAGILDLDIFR